MTKATKVMLAGKEVPLNELLIHKTPPTDDIQQMGINAIKKKVDDWIDSTNEIRTIVYRKNLEAWRKESRWLILEACPIEQPRLIRWLNPREFTWTWNVTTGIAKGKLPIRISKFYFDEYGISMPKELLADIGTIAATHRIKGDIEHRFRFTDELWWERGEFGDPGSCWFSDRTMARPLLRGAGGLAVQFFKTTMPVNDVEGLARCWLIPAKPFADTFVVFNGYGKDNWRGNPLNEMTTILADYFKLEKMKVAVANQNEMTSDMFYLNGDAFVIGPATSLEKVRSFDLNIEEQFTCEDCGDLMLSHEEAWTDHRHFAYCDKCKGKHVSISRMPTLKKKYHCDNCGDDYDEGDGQEDPDGDWLCEDCFSNIWTSCSRCEEYCKEDEQHEVKVMSRPSRFGGADRYYEQYWCESCWENYADSCSECDDNFEDSEMIDTADDRHYCPKCAANHVMICDVCSEAYSEDNVHYNEEANQAMCEDCQRDWVNEKERREELELEREIAEEEAKSIQLPLPLDVAPKE